MNYMTPSLKNSTYNTITYLRSLKNTFPNSLYKEQLYLTNRIYNISILTLINLILKSHEILYKKFNVTSLLKYYTVNNKKSVLSKYMQSYIYTSSKQNNFSINFYRNMEEKMEAPINLIELNSLYINYKLLRSRNPIYIYYKIDHKL